MFARIRERAFDHCVPLNVTLELTLRCNLRCVHCYNFDRDRPYPIGRRDDELADDEVLRILGEVHAAGCLEITFSGGEAMLHPRITDFAAHARSLGMAVRIKSNGTLFSPAMVERLAAAGVHAVDISLYGAAAETHDRFVRKPGAFAQTLDGIRAAHEHGMNTQLSIVLVRANAGELEGMIALARSLGVTATMNPHLSARYDGTREPLDERINRPTLERLYRGPLRDLTPAPSCTRDRSLQCACARSVCGISAHGEVYPCIGAPMPSGNLRRQSFAEIWKSSPQLNWIRGLQRSDFAACQSCAHQAHCQRSSGVLFVNTGQYTGPARFGDDWTCMEAELLHQLHDERGSE